MALRRKLNEYRNCIESGRSNEPVIPTTTWRRWLAHGKITEEQLLEIGINPRCRKRRKRDQAQNHTQHEAGDLPDNHTEQSSASVSGSTFASLENDVESQQRSPSNTSLTHNTEITGNDSDLISDDESTLLNDSLEAQTISSSSDCSDEDQDNRISSVLESKKIGVEVLNQPLTANMKVTKFEALLMISHLAMRHGLTDVFVEDLMSFVNELVGDPNAIPGSKYLFHKLFLFGSQPIIHFFCPECDVYLGPKGSFDNNKVICESCDWSQSVTSLNNNNYFVTLSIKDQIKTVLSRPNIKLVAREQTVDRVISDMFHGKIYKDLMKTSHLLDNDKALTISISTDGSPVFKNGPNTLYPIHFHLNEIPPEERFDIENIMLAGLFFSKKGEPNLQMFLKPLVDEIQSLQKNGVIWKRPDGCVVESPIYLTCVCADSVARAKIQNLTQFNGGYGCSYCLHPNTSFILSERIKNRGGKVQIPTTLTDSSDTNSEDDDQLKEIIHRRKIKRYLVGQNYPYRTHKGLKNHMRLADHLKGSEMYGAKGLCVLTILQALNIVFGVPIDYMHAILLGVTKRLANLWFDGTSKGNPYYIGDKVETVNGKLIEICPPSSMAKPRPMSERVHWKAKEWRGFLMYYGLPCLMNVLPTPFYDHFKKLVTAIFILTKEAIGYDECEEADSLLQEFVTEYQDLYGEKNMVYNVHLTSHLGKQVAKLGPLWAYSMFHFETANGRLVKLVKGTKGVATQIARKYLMTNTVSKLLRGSYKVSESVLNFCSKVVEYKYRKNSSKCGLVRLLGRPILLELHDDYKEAFQRCGFHIENKFARIYNRVVINGVMYSSKGLGRQKACNDSCVRLQDGSFVVIEYIVSMNEENSDVWCLAIELNIATNVSNIMPPHVKQCALDSFGPIRVFPLQHLKTKCFFISWGEKNFVAEFSNKYEKS